jgi:hypothetical protein
VLFNIKNNKKVVAVSQPKNGRHEQRQGQMDVSQRQAARAQGQAADGVVGEDALAAEPGQKTRGAQRPGEADHPRGHSKGRIARESRAATHWVSLFLLFGEGQNGKLREMYCEIICERYQITAAIQLHCI